MTNLKFVLSRRFLFSALVSFMHFSLPSSSRRTTPQHDVLGPSDVRACDANYGKPFYGDCEGAILDLRNSVRPHGYDDWTATQMDTFDLEPREYQREGEGRPRTWPDDPLVAVPLGWQRGTCFIAITLKAANSMSDLSNWQDIYDNFRTLNLDCPGTRSAGTGGTMVTGENNRVRIEIYGPDAKLKKYQKLKDLCKYGTEYRDLPQCNSDRSTTEGVSAGLLAQLQQANIGAPLVQGQCAANTYSLSNGGPCKGYLYDLITLSKDALGVLFGVPSTVKWADTGAYVLSTASEWIDGASN